MARLGQIESVTASGFGSFPIKEDSATFQPSITERELVKGQRRSDSGFIDKEQNGAIFKSALLHRTGITPQSINDLTDVMLTIKFTNGETHVMPEAFNVSVGELGNGEFDVEFHSAESRQR